MALDGRAPEVGETRASWKVWAVPCSLTLAAAIYGSWAVIAKVALGHHGVSPLVLSFYRVLGGSSVMFMMHRVLEAPGPVDKLSVWRPQLSECLRFLGLGLLLSMNVSGNILAIKSLSPVTVAVFQPLVPVLAGIAAAVLRVEDISALKVLGILCATTGAVLVVILGPAAHGHGSALAGGQSLLRGILWLLVNVCGGALYAVFQKGVLRKHPPIFTAASAFAVAAGVLFIGAISVEGFNAEAWRLAGSERAILALMYCIFLTTALNYSVLAWANKRSTPTTVTSFLTLQPIFAAVLARVFLGEVLTWGQIGGGFAIFVGLGFFLSSKPMEISAPEEEAALVLPKGSDEKGRV